MPITDQGPLPTLSEGDKKAIRESWPQIYQNFEQTGLVVLLEFLQKNPGAQQSFPKFSATKCNLEQDNEVKWQASRIINAVNHTIGLMDKEAAMKQYLKELSAKHSSEFQVDPKLFKELSAIFVSTIRGKAAYEKLFSIICTLLRSSYDE
uniref:Hemoglobin n=1 Tax=Myxine glutinosa TaxID=7769 RepID=Q9Y0E6_MYXGL|nr:hemoglobin [Myxine glutinosa]